MCLNQCRASTRIWTSAWGIPQHLNLTATPHSEDLVQTHAGPELAASVSVNSYASCLVNLEGHFLLVCPITFHPYNLHSYSSQDSGASRPSTTQPFKKKRVHFQCMGLFKVSVFTTALVRFQGEFPRLFSLLLLCATFVSLHLLLKTFFNPWLRRRRNKMKQKRPCKSWEELTKINVKDWKQNTKDLNCVYGEGQSQNGWRGHSVWAWGQSGGLEQSTKMEMRS